MDSVYHVPPGSDLYTLLSACCPSTDTSGLSWSSFSTPSDDDSPYGSPSFNQSDSRVDSLMCNGVRNDGRGEQCAGDAAAALLSPTISLPSPRHRRRNVKPSLSSGFIGMQSKFSTNSKTYMLPQAPEAWECRKRELRCLYLEQDKTLKDIMYIMEQKGFKASVKMYKTRFKQWGFVKNNSREDITKMLQIRRQRATVGKSTTFKRNGKTVKIDEYLRKNGAIIWEPRGYGTPEGLPNSVRCHTPPLDTPRHLRTSDTLLLKELLIWCLKDLSPSFFHLTRHGNKTNSVNSELWDVPRYLRLACDLFSESRHSQAGSICRSAFTSVHYLIFPPRLDTLFNFLVGQLWWTNGDITKELWHYLSTYMSHVLGSKNELYHLFQALIKYIGDHGYAAYLDLITECIEDLLCIEDDAPLWRNNQLVGWCQLIIMDAYFQNGYNNRADRIQARCAQALPRSRFFPKDRAMNEQLWRETFMRHTSTSFVSQKQSRHEKFLRLAFLSHAKILGSMTGSPMTHPSLCRIEGVATSLANKQDMEPSAILTPSRNLSLESRILQFLTRDISTSPP